MKVYEAKRFKKEIRDRETIMTGCCFTDSDPMSLGKFDTLEKALAAIRGFEPSCRIYHYNITFYEVEEYAVEIYDADEDGEFISGSDFETLYDFKWNLEIGNIEITERNI